MSKEYVETVSGKRGLKRWVISLIFILGVVPATLLVSWHFGDRKYYLCSVVLMVYAMIPFFTSFERRRPQARELVTIAVMSAAAVASRAAFIMVPFLNQ